MQTDHVVKEPSIFGYFIACCTKRPLKFSGRANRKEYFGFMASYLLYYLMLFLLFIVSYAMREKFDIMSDSIIINLIIGIMIVSSLLIVPASYAVTARRMHDTGHSAWNMLIPIVSLVYVLLPGDEQENEYGAPPCDTWGKQTDDCDQPWFVYALECCTTKLFDFKGRARRREFWCFLFSFMALIVIYVALGYRSFNEPLIPVSVTAIACDAMKPLVVLFVVALLSVSVRRLHDLNISGWFAIILLPLFIFFPLFGQLIFLVEGKAHANKYGNDPKQAKRNAQQGEPWQAAVLQESDFTIFDHEDGVEEGNSPTTFYQP